MTPDDPSVPRLREERDLMLALLIVLVKKHSASGTLAVTADELGRIAASGASLIFGYTGDGVLLSVLAPQANAPFSETRQ